MRETLFENCSVENVVVLENDIPDLVLVKALKYGTVNWDIETAGPNLKSLLDWKVGKLALCQIFIQGDNIVYVIKQGKNTPVNLIALLESPQIKKVFHYAMFDLMFLRKAWDYVRPANIACTKIASKITFELRESHRLMNLLEEFELAKLDKALGTSNWEEELSPEQIKYAAKDVIYLARLLTGLFKCSKNARELERKNKLILEAFKHIPTRVELEYRGHMDVYTY